MEQHAHQKHGASAGVYAMVFAALLALTVVTVGLSYVNLTHTGNIIAALIVATFKALLVALFFMHLKYEGRLLRFTAIFPLILFCIMIGALILDIVIFLKPH
ncbi:MAG TPA: cytochrome C oxidase subunit IV family protein [Nitrososphaera sp.]|nr:cytochrome C oxidase subunit IV family protein [Nitrososphaera sp.]